MLNQTNMAPENKADFESWLQAGNSVFQQCQLPTDIANALREWHRLAWFTAQGTDQCDIHDAGLKPGGPTADLMFAFIFSCFHKKNISALKEEHFEISINLHGLSLTPLDQQPTGQEMGVPAFLDDLIIPIEG